MLKASGELDSAATTMQSPGTNGGSGGGEGSGGLAEGGGGGDGGGGEMHSPSHSTRYSTTGLTPVLIVAKAYSPVVDTGSGAREAHSVSPAVVSGQLPCTCLPLAVVPSKDSPVPAKPTRTVT